MILNLFVGDYCAAILTKHRCAPVFGAWEEPSGKSRILIGVRWPETLTSRWYLQSLAALIGGWEESSGKSRRKTTGDLDWSESAFEARIILVYALDQR